MGDFNSLDMRAAALDGGHMLVDPADAPFRLATYFFALGWQIGVDGVVDSAAVRQAYTEALDDIFGSEPAEHPDVVHARCRNCEQPIQAATEGDPGVPKANAWKHLDSARSRSCRSASFDRASGWNKSLKDSWKAAPSDVDRERMRRGLR